MTISIQIIRLKPSNSSYPQEKPRPFPPLTSLANKTGHVRRKHVEIEPFRARVPVDGPIPTLVLRGISFPKSIKHPIPDDRYLSGWPFGVPETGSYGSRLERGRRRSRCKLAWSERWGIRRFVCMSWPNGIAGAFTRTFWGCLENWGTTSRCGLPRRCWNVVGQMLNWLGLFAIQRGGILFESSAWKL